MCATTSIVMVTRRMVRERAVILAVVVGRSVQEVSKADWEQAKWELTGEPAQGPKKRINALDASCGRWQSAPGHKVQVLIPRREGVEVPLENARILWPR
jgi:hypothetical protein